MAYSWETTKNTTVVPTTKKKPVNETLDTGSYSWQKKPVTTEQPTYSPAVQQAVASLPKKTFGEKFKSVENYMGDIAEEIPLGVGTAFGSLPSGILSGVQTIKRRLQTTPQNTAAFRIFKTLFPEQAEKADTKLRGISANPASQGFDTLIAKAKEKTDILKKQTQEGVQAYREGRDLTGKVTREQDKMNIAEKGVNALATTVGYMIPAFLAAPAVGASGASLIGGFIEAGSDSSDVYDQLIAQGKSKKEAEDKADIQFTTSAIVNGLSNRVGIFGNSKSFLKRIINSELSEVPAETLTQLSSNILTGKNWDENLIETAITTAAITPFLGAMGGNLSPEQQVILKDKVEEKLSQNEEFNSLPPLEQQKVIEVLTTPPEPTQEEITPESLDQIANEINQFKQTEPYLKKEKPQKEELFQTQVPKKSQFSSPQIRELKPEEQSSLQKVNDVLQGKSKTEVIAHTPDFVSQDGKERPLIFDKAIANKIKGHGEMSAENLVINANDWDYVMKNVQGNPDKINLIKSTTGEGFIRIGADRQNGFFIVTHYENIPGKSQKLKNLLSKGDFLDRSGKTRDLSFATSPKGAASQLEGNVSGVRTGAPGGTRTPSSLARNEVSYPLDNKSNTKTVSQKKKPVKTEKPKPQTQVKSDIKTKGFVTSQQAVEEAMNIPIFKELHARGQVVLAEQLNNRKALGSYFNSVIKYVKDPHNTTLPHEAFHAFADMVLTPQEKEQALDLVRERGMSDLQAEEKLAQQFAEWYVAQNKKSKLQVFFEKIAKFFKGLVKDQDKVQALFSSVLSKKSVAMVDNFKKAGGITALRLEYNQNPNEFTTQLFENSEVWKGNANIKKATLIGALGRLRKPLMKDYVSNKIDTEFKGQEVINVEELKRSILADLLDMKIIESDSYANYGMDSIRVNSYEAKAKTYIINTNFIHGKTGHFSGQFDVRTAKEDLEIRTIQAGQHEVEGQMQNVTKDQYYVVRKDLSADNLEAGVFDKFDSEKEAQAYVDKFTDRVTSEPGMFGHFRAFTGDANDSGKPDTFSVMEFQSDVFQKNMASFFRTNERLMKNDLAILDENIAGNKEALARMEETFRKYKNTTSKEANEEAKDQMEMKKKFIAQDEAEKEKVIKKYSGKNVYFTSKVEGQYKGLKILVDDLKQKVGLYEEQLAQKIDVTRSDFEPPSSYRFKLDWYNRDGSIDAVSFNELKKEYGEDKMKAFEAVFANDDGILSADETNNGWFSIVLKEKKARIAAFNKNILPEIKKAISELDSMVEFSKNLDAQGKKGLTPAQTKEIALSEQFLSFKNNYYEVIINSAIRQAAISGVDEIRFPTPYTVANVEGYISTEEDPYGDAGQYTEAEINDMDVGDDIEYFGGGAILSDKGHNSYSIITSDDDLHAVSVDDVKEGEVENYENEFNDMADIEDLQYRMTNLVGEGNLTEKQQEALIDKIDKAESIKDLEDIDGFDEAKEKMVEDYERDFDAEDFYDVTYGRDRYKTFTKNGQEFIVDAGGSDVNEETQSYKTTYEGDASSFVLADIESEDHRTIAAKYGVDENGKQGEFYKYISKKRADLEEVTDPNGYTWYKSKITPQDKMAVEMFQTEDQIGKEQAVPNPEEIRNKELEQELRREAKLKTLKENIIRRSYVNQALDAIRKNIPPAERFEYMTQLSRIGKTASLASYKDVIKRVYTRAEQIDIEKGESKELARKRSTIAFLRKLYDLSPTLVKDAKSTLAISKPISKMEQSELDALLTEMQNRIAYLKVNNLVRKPQTNEMDYEDFIAIGKEKPRKKAVTIKRVGKEIVGGLKDLTMTIGQRIKNISPQMFFDMETMVFNTNKFIKDQGEPVLENLKKTVKELKKIGGLDVAFTAALYSKRYDVAEKILTDNSMDTSIINDSQELFNDIFNKLKSVDVNVEYLEGFFPRYLTKEAQLKMESRRNTDLGNAIDEDRAKLGRDLNQKEVAKTYGNYFRGFDWGSKLLLSDGRFGESREIDVLDSRELVENYQSLAESMGAYVNQAINLYESRKFFNKFDPDFVETVKNGDFESGIVHFVESMGAKQNYTGAQLKDLQTNLQAFFSKSSAVQSDIVKGIMQFAYTTGLGQIVSFIPQALEAGTNTAINLEMERTNPFVKLNIKPADIYADIRFDATEDKFSAFSDMVTTPMRKGDMLGALVGINQLYGVIKKQAQTSSPRLREKLEYMYGKDKAESVMDILANSPEKNAGKLSPEMARVLFSEMSERRVISRLDKSKLFIKHPFWGVFKSYTVKMLTKIINDGNADVKRGIDTKDRALVAQGIRKKAVLIAALLLAGASQGLLKDLIRKGEIGKIPDYILNAYLGIFGLNRYGLDNLGKEGITNTIYQTIAPAPLAIPLSLAETLISDIDKRSVEDWKIFERFPVGGDVIKILRNRDVI